MQKDLSGFTDFFKQVPDHRIDRNKLHPVEEILLITLCGTIAGCDGWEDIELFGKTKLDELKAYLPFNNGAPSDDTLRRFFEILNPDIFEACFVKWVKAFGVCLEDKVIAIDGKTSRRSFDRARKAMHMVSAFASESGITLGQQKVDEKSNEITAIPDLLDALDVKGAIITIDAMGCQKNIARKITAKEADYLFSLKGNQGNLHDDVRCVFEHPARALTYHHYSETDKGHGRIETRQCTVTEDIQWLKERYPDWQSVQTIAEITSTRIQGDKVSTEKRYYISSLPADPKKVLYVTRAHWGIENKLHWTLDVCFGDDQSRIRKGHAPENMAVIKKAVLNLLQLAKKAQPRLSIRKMRKLAGWDPTFLGSVLKAKF